MSPTYSQILDDEVIINYTAEQGDQDTPSDLDRYIIAAPQEVGSNLKISPASNSYGCYIARKVFGRGNRVDSEEKYNGQDSDEGRAR